MRRPIKIEDVLFADGTIEKYEFNSTGFNMQFRDYADTELVFFFSKDVEVKEQKGLGFSVYESHLEKANGRMKLRLLDDDLIEMLNIEFGLCTVSMVQ